MPPVFFYRARKQALAGQLLCNAAAMNADARSDEENSPVIPAVSLVQVMPGHYQSQAYDELHRWVSYWYQIQAVARHAPKTALEIGIGSGILSSYLRTRLNIQVTTFDFDAALNPDLVGDVRHLEAMVEDGQFEAVLAFQILEHLPFSDFEPALRQLTRASSRSVLLSLPHYGWDLQARFRLWKSTWAFGRRISKKPLWHFDGEHHWEIGTKNHSLKQVRAVLQRVVQIERDYFCADYPYHYFFECRRK